MNGTSMTTVMDEEQVKSKRYFYLTIKRLFDIIVSGISLILLSPLFLIIGIMIKMDSKGKVIFKQKRIGKHGEPIYIYKFRTMTPNAEEVLEKMLKENPDIYEEYTTNKKLKNDPRVTKFGNILRKTSLDELPQLLNILNGDMSIVGPRPVIDSEIEKYGDLKEYFLSVIPGLTGWWACNGRSCTSYDERKRLELYYIQHRGIMLDLKIIFKTFTSVLKRDGAK